jgi:hypothetical protein
MLARGSEAGPVKEWWVNIGVSSEEIVRQLYLEIVGHDDLI